MADDAKNPGALADATGVLVDVHASADHRETITLGGHQKRKCSRERDDDYRAEIVRLNGMARVIVCKDDHQWILQRARTGRQRRTEWRAARYFRSRKALIAACVANCGPCDPAAIARLALLPEVFA